MSAYLLVTHGSRDSRPGLVMQELVTELQSRGVPCVDVASLELASHPLSEQIQDFAEYAWSLGYKRVVIAPLFLLAGVHLMEDIPMQVEIAQAGLAGKVEIEVKTYLGAYSGVEGFLRRICQRFVDDNLYPKNISQQLVILLAHGSRRVDGNTAVEALATNLNGLTAYWSLTPNLESRLAKLNQEDTSVAKVVVVPYFLFAGKITDAIAASIDALKLQFPTIKIYQAQPLGVNEGFADLIWDWLVDERK